MRRTWVDTAYASTDCVANTWNEVDKITRGFLFAAWTAISTASLSKWVALHEVTAHTGADGGEARITCGTGIDGSATCFGGGTGFTGHLRLQFSQ